MEMFARNIYCTKPVVNHFGSDLRTSKPFRICCCGLQLDCCIFSPCTVWWSHYGWTAACLSVVICLAFHQTRRISKSSTYSNCLSYISISVLYLLVELFTWWFSEIVNTCNVCFVVFLSNQFSLRLISCRTVFCIYLHCCSDHTYVCTNGNK